MASSTPSGENEKVFASVFVDLAGQGMSGGGLFWSASTSLGESALP